MLDRRLLALILLFTFPLPAEAQNPCRGLTEAACRANPRCFWPFTSPYCIQNTWYDPARANKPAQSAGPGIMDYLAGLYVVIGFVSLGFLGWVVYRLFTEGRKPVEPYYEADGPERHLHAAYNYINPISDQTSTDTDKVFADLVNLTKAAEHIMHARRANPAAQIVVTEKNRREVFTIDALSFLALYEEAVLFHALASQGNPHALFNKDYRTRTDGPKALEAITKALNYRPHSTTAWTMRGRILLGLGRTSDARDDGPDPARNVVRDRGTLP